jgi:lipoprotein signal peptidase
MFFDYVIFGIVDNGVMLLGAFFGIGLEKYLPRRFQVGLGAIIGAGIGNTASDFMGGAVSLNWPLAFGTGLGCVMALILIPLFYKFQKRSK